MPIDLGGWCRGAKSSTPRPGSFRTVESYVNPNAICPVCRETMFFYQSPYGGRVFFDGLGWPWPRHPCTGKNAAQTGTVKSPRRSSDGGITLRNSTGTQFEVYEIAEMPRMEAGWDIKLRRVSDRSVFNVHLSDVEIKGAKLKWDDFHDAPSFVAVPSMKGRPTRTVQFICERLKRIVTIELTKI